MKTRLKRRSLMSTYGPWLAVIMIPLAANALVWRAFVVPQQAGLRASRTTRVLTELQPKLAALISETHQTLAQWQQTSFASDDPSAVMQAVRQLAGRHHVDVRELALSSVATPSAERGTSSVGSTIPIEFEAVGRFNHLARWMSDVERQSGLQVDSWNLTPATAADQSCRLTVKMTAFLQGA